MCGIAGFFGNPALGLDERTARRMADLLRHRGPDDEGAWSDPEAGIAMAQRRLAVIDLTPAGHQPMISPGGRYVLVFNGEIYNHRDIRADLDALGQIAWHGHSDTEVLLAAIERWGLKSALSRAAGMFAVALWDRRERTLSLARDRLGEKPLYYGRVGGTFAFASEINAFKALPAWRPDIDRGSLALLMRHGCVPAPYSIYRGIEKLRPGHILTLGAANAEPRIETYWSAADAAAKGRRFSGSADDAAAETERLIEQSLRGQMLADVPVGAFLSGGIDSSAVVAIMQSLGRSPVRTFTVGFSEAGFDEAAHARDVAKHLGTDHTELYVSDRMAMDVIPSLPQIYCEPFADSSQIPTFLVAQLARKTVTVALTGDGGDELFSGYNRYRFTDAHWRRLSHIPRPIRAAAAALAALPSPDFYDRVAGKLGLRQRHPGDAIHKAAAALALPSGSELYRKLCSQWEPDDIVADAPEPPTMPTGLEPIPSLAGDVERMMYLDMTSYLPDDILVKVDRAAMANSLETRVPLLDHRLVEFALTVPLSLLHRDGAGKWPLRQILHKRVPRSLVDRPKMGFGIPVGQWLRGTLRDWAEELLSEKQLRADGFFKPKPIREAWAEHLSGRRNNQHALWNVLMFQAWRNS